MKNEWRDIHMAAYGSEWAEPPKSKIAVVSTRYTGCYEGGLFAAIPVEALESEAFGDDCEAADWWEADALQDWYRKQERA